MRGGQVQQLMSAQGVQNAIMQRAERFRATDTQDKKDTRKQQTVKIHLRHLQQ